MEMDEQPSGRFKVVVGEGSPHGDLYELEQTIYYRLRDTHSKKVVMAFQREMEASLSRSTGVCGFPSRRMKSRSLSYTATGVRRLYRYRTR
jgi:hypothetical protein